MAVEVTAPGRGTGNGGERLRLPEAVAVEDAGRIYDAKIGQDISTNVSQLAEGNFFRREQASHALLKLGASHPHAVRTALTEAAGSSDLEVRRRAENVLERLFSPESRLINTGDEAPTSVLNRYTRRTRFTLNVTSADFPLGNYSVDSSEVSVRVGFRDMSGKPIGIAIGTSAVVREIRRNPEGNGFLVSLEIGSSYRNHVDSVQMEIPLHSRHNREGTPVVVRSKIENIQFGPPE